jgi:hypothetical protein
MKTKFNKCKSKTSDHEFFSLIEKIVFILPKIGFQQSFSFIFNMTIVNNNVTSKESAIARIRVLFKIKLSSVIKKNLEGITDSKSIIFLILSLLTC